MTKGIYSNFTGVKYKGSFKHGKWVKGKVRFPDGELLKGVWGYYKGKYVLK